jgi:hypothetical protein
MLMDLFLIFAAAGPLAGLYALAAAGFRNGDRPGDARVSAALRAATLPGARSVTATVRNPSGTPVLVALRVRRAVLPAWLAGAGSAWVPRWTARRKFRPDRYDAVGAVPPGRAADFTLFTPPRARRCLLTVVTGQEGGRLRASRLRLGPVCYTATGRDELIMVT